MTIETDADLDVFFNTDELAVAADWTLSGGGGPVSVAVIPSVPDEFVGLSGDVGLVLPQPRAKVAVKDLPVGYGKGDGLVMGGVSYTVERVEKDATERVAEVILRATV